MQKDKSIDDKARQLLSANIKNLRKIRGYSQLQLSQKSDIALSFIAAIETQKKFPSSTSLSKLAKALNVEIYELFYEAADREEKLTSYTDIADFQKNLSKQINSLIETSFDNYHDNFTTAETNIQKLTTKDKQEIFELKNFKTDAASVEEMKSLINHLKDLFSKTYVYVVGEWNKGHRARNMRNGKTVKNEEVIKYLQK